MNRVVITAAAAALLLGAAGGFATGSNKVMADTSGVMNPMIDGQAMLAGATIYGNVAKSPEHARFAAALDQAGLKAALNGAGDYTVFAPTDRAFAELPASRKAATGYLVVKGRWDSQALLARINEDGGRTRLTTLNGHRIVAMMNGPTNIALMDETGATANIAIYDIYQSNGVMQVIDRVLVPGKGGNQVAGL